MRGKVVGYMKEHLREFETEVDASYIKKMSTAGVWATDIEIRATARLLQTPIFTWVRCQSGRWQWQRFPPGVSLDEPLRDTAVPAIYLQNTSSCHFVVVTSVMEDDE